jgi:hypothetical protein
MFIAGFYIFGALILLISIFTNFHASSQLIANVHGLPTSMGGVILPLIAALAILIAYGLFSLSTWGFYLTLLYLIYFGIVNAFLAGKQGIQPYLGNCIWAALVIFYLLLRRKLFFGRNDS